MYFWDSAVTHWRASPVCPLFPSMLDTTNSRWYNYNMEGSWTQSDWTSHEKDVLSHHVSREWTHSVSLPKLSYISLNYFPLCFCLKPLERLSCRIWSMEVKHESFCSPYTLLMIGWLPAWYEVVAWSVNCSIFPWSLLQLLWFLGHVCVSLCDNGLQPLHDTHITQVKGDKHSCKFQSPCPHGLPFMPMPAPFHFISIFSNWF